ncbi:unnamed protein product [Diatraea saccharalis]|uniref:Integrase catalytic domain-containing protein n=1 Tax=Diatraea saccharalis TaxID=40085 RepID=A0A9N9WA97_9NEOP|nr:unnamed protein product [Diatraea saccharalis]
MDKKESADNEKSDCKDDVDRHEFYRRIKEVFKKKFCNTYLLTRQKYLEIIEQVKSAHSRLKKTALDYRRVKRYVVVDTPSGERLFLARKDGKQSQQMFVTMEETYDIIRDYHLKFNHCGKNRLMKAMKLLYRNITTESVMVYLQLCGPCRNKLVKRNRALRQSLDQPKHQRDVDEINKTDPLAADTFIRNETEVDDTKESFKHPELYSRAQVDILDVTTEPNEEYKFMLVYRDYMNKYIHLKPLKSLSVDESVDAILEICLVFGAPNILQSKNGLDIITPICRRLNATYPNIKVVPGANVFNDKDLKGKTNGDILKVLNSWLALSQSTKWQLGLKFVQHSLNTKFDETICRTPSEIVFGTNPRKGIASFLTKEECDYIMSEEDLKTALEKKENPQNQTLKQLKLEESLVLQSNFIKIETEQLSEDDDIIDDNISN